MRELSVFIDESGDFGPYSPHCPYYLITLVFHNQSHSIASEVDYLKKHIVEQGFSRTHCVHSGPLIRRETDYSSLELGQRKKLFRAIFSFTLQSDIGFKTFVFKEKEFRADHDGLVSRMAREIGGYVRNNLGFFQSFGRIVVYYDNGQKEITNIVNTVFNTLLEAEVKPNVTTSAIASQLGWRTRARRRACCPAAPRCRTCGTSSCTSPGSPAHPG